MRKIAMILILGLIVVGGAACSVDDLGRFDGVKVEREGETLVGHECVARPDGGKCCTSTAPIEGKQSSVTVCYGPEGNKE